jgi:hypothetical protein
MIKIESRITSKNARLIVVELGGINSNSDGDIHKLSSKISTVSNINESLNLEIASINSTFLINSFIWILILSYDSLIFDILIGGVHKATITSIVAVSIGAIHKLLCGETNQGLSFDFV